MKQGLTDGKAGHRSGVPEPWVARFAPLVRAGGTVLDLACGGGRHARFFLARGHPTVALDRDISGVADLAGRPLAEIVGAELEDGSPWPLGDRRFAAVVVVNYLWRPVFPAVLAALEPGGVLLWQTFAAGNERFGRPSNPNFLLRPGELLALADDRLSVVAYEHGEVARPRPAVIQRICAVNGAATDGPFPLPD